MRTTTHRTVDPATWRLMLAAAGVLLLATDAAAADRPNILLILTDDQGWWDLNSHGNENLDTPNMDRIAREGVEFTRFYVQPVCGPTRAGILTGRYFPRTGLWENRFGGNTVRSGEITIAEVLKAQGYRTGVFGKWHLGDHGDSRPYAQGFDVALTFPYGHAERYNYADQFNYNGRPVATKGYITDFLTDAAISFIESGGSRPFFCYLPYNVPHEPFKAGDGASGLWQPGAKLIEQYLARGVPLRTARIYALIERCDGNIGRLLDRIEQLDLADNTIVMFMSDNGGVHRTYTAGLRGGKGSVYEGGVRSPLFVRWPGHFPSGAKVDAMASHVDLLPTICELAGAEPPADRVLDGRSIAGLMRDGKGASPHDYLYFTWRRHGPRVDENWAIADQHYKLAKGQLFDLTEDPGETKDVAGEHPDRVKQMRAEYVRWFDEVTDGLVYEPVAIEVGRDDENPVEIQSSWAGLQGDSVTCTFAGYEWDTIEGWKQPGEQAVWKIDVVAPGTYEVALSYGAAPKSAGSRLRISAGETSFEHVVQSTVTANTFVRRPVGELQLTSGRHLLRAEVLQCKGDELMRLNRVFLRRLDATPQ